MAQSLASLNEDIRAALESRVTSRLEQLVSATGQLATAVPAEREGVFEGFRHALIEQSIAARLDQIGIGIERIPGRQGGEWNTTEGLRYVHAGEMIAPAPVASWIREHGVTTPVPVAMPVMAGRNGGDSAGGSLTVAFEPGAIVTADPEKAADLAVRKIERLWRDRGRRA